MWGFITFVEEQIFGILFIGAGMFAAGYSAWALLQLLLVGKTHVKLKHHPLCAGDDLVILVHHSRRLRIERLNVDLVL